MDRLMMEELFAEFCPIRDKYAKVYDFTKDSCFELYSTTTEPGLVSIYYNEDQKSFSNWKLEAGSGRKRGRIRDVFDNQIGTQVLEIQGHHNGSVYMMCPPDPHSIIDVQMPFVTILMRDIHGYSSVEFTVLDTLGFSRKIHAKNFKARCTIGELNCEVPMRLSPTWNYACVNLNETLMNAFGTYLDSVQRIKINANCRVRRVYFSEQILPFKNLPEEFRVKLTLSAKEKEEIEIYEQFLSSEPVSEEGQTPPWALPKLNYLPSDLSKLSVTPEARKQKGLLRKRVAIMEVPAVETDPEKYKNVAEAQHSNADLLRHMLNESIPASKILLPTLSLIYPDKESPFEAEAVQAGKIKMTKLKGKKVTCEEGEEERSHLAKLKKCLEQYAEQTDENENEAEGEHKGPTDWDVINHEIENDDEDSQPNQPHHHINGCKYNTSELAQYVKHREVLGEYDLFSGTAKKPNFLEDGQGEDDDYDEEELLDDLEGMVLIEEEEDFQLNPDFAESQTELLQPSDTLIGTRSTSRTSRNTMSRLTLQNASSGHVHMSEDVTREPSLAKSSSIVLGEAESNLN